MTTHGGGSASKALLDAQFQAQQEQKLASRAAASPGGAGAMDEDDDGPEPAPKLPDLQIRLVCKNCRDKVPNIVEDFKAGEIVCGTCGYVFQSRLIDTRSEWRTFSNDEGGDDPSRVGGPGDPILGSNRLEGTGIGGLDGLGRGSKLAKAQIAISRTGSNIKEHFRDIETICERLGMPKIVSDTAKMFFRKVDEEKLARGRSPDAIKGACIYIASAQHRQARSFKEIVAATKVQKKELGRVYKMIQKHLITTGTTVLETTSPDFKSLIERVDRQLNLDFKYTQHAHKLVQKVREAGILEGRQWTTIVAACIFAVSNIAKDERDRKSAGEIAGLCGCTDITLRGAYRQIYDDRDTLMPAEEYAAIGDVKNLPP